MFVGDADNSFLTELEEVQNKFGTYYMIVYLSVLLAVSIYAVWKEHQENRRNKTNNSHHNILDNSGIYCVVIEQNVLLI